MQNFQKEIFFKNYQDTILLESKGYVKQSNKITEAVFTDASINAKKMLAYIISTLPDNLSAHDFAHKRFFSPADKLLELLEQGRRKNYGEKDSLSYFRLMKNRIRNIVSEIRTIGIVVSETGKIKGKVNSYKEIVHYSNIFTEFIYEKQYEYLDNDKVKGKLGFYYEFNPKLREYFVELKRRYTIYDLSEYISLSSKYSMRLYELLAQFRTTGWRKESLEDFRKLLGIKGEKFGQFSNFLQRVLAPAKKELEKTSLAFEFQLEVIPLEDIGKSQEEQNKKIVNYTPKKLLGYKVIGIVIHLKKPHKFLEKKQTFTESQEWKSVRPRRRKALLALINFGINEQILAEKHYLFTDSELEEIQQLFYKLQFDEKFKNKVDDQIAYKNGIFKVKIKQKETLLEELNFLEYVK